MSDDKTIGVGRRVGDHDGDDWPVELHGVTETVVATPGPNDRWNFVALGVHTSETDGDPPASAPSSPSTTTTAWGSTRTRRNLHRQGDGVIQFVSNPRAFVEVAMTIYEWDSPVLDSADAWAEVEATSADSDEDGGIEWESWELRPVDAAVERTWPLTTNRGFGAVIDTTVVVPRLDVLVFDIDDLLVRLDYFVGTAEKCDGGRGRGAFVRIDELTSWRERAAARQDESLQCSSGKSSDMAIKPKCVKQFGNTLLERYPQAFNTDFEMSKDSVEELTTVESKSIRNRIAGYITCKKGGQGA